MYFSVPIIALSLLALTAASFLRNDGLAKYQKHQQGVAQEIKTIGTHSAADAAQIPLAALVSRTFFYHVRFLFLPTSATLSSESNKYL